LLELEITESAAMQNTEACIATLKELKALGVHLALDDFGTGYSSLSYLKRLPVDTVKIDRSFITDLATNPDDASIAQAIINMAHNLGLKVVAEGVETLPQLAFLGAHGCDCMQGYYFSRALPEHEATALLRENRRLQRPAASAHGDERTLLLLDDEENVLSALKRLLRRDSYRILTASSAREAFEILASHKVGVIVSDQRMPEGTGVAFLRRVKQLYPDSVRMALSGYTDLDSVTDAINQGAIYRFLTKPWEDSLLRAHIAEAFWQYSRLQEAKRTHESTSTRIAELTDANRVLEKTLAGLGAAPQLRLVPENAA
jgi:FixJ family two-component response regulator